MSDNYVLAMYQKLRRFPAGNWLFSNIIARRAPYFRTINPRITKLSAHHCECFIKKTKRVENHIGTVHVIAICNGLEMAMGVMAEASIPKHLRWIPKGMTVDYTAKAGTDITCVAKVDASQWQVGDLIVPVQAYDTHGTVVVSGSIKLWISEKPVKTVR